MREPEARATVPQPHDGVLSEWDGSDGPRVACPENAGTFGCSALRRGRRLRG